MRRVYLKAGLFAEGPTDYDFLLPLLDRMLEEIAAHHWPSGYEIAQSEGIDAPPERKTGKRSLDIAAAIYDSPQCTLFVIHSDGEGDPARCQRERIDPGIEEASRLSVERFSAVPCLPVRETESWMLADPEPFRLYYGASFSSVLPTQPEKEVDPKATLREIMRLAEKSPRMPPESKIRELMPLFSEKVELKLLRRLKSFQEFEGALELATREVARFQGFP